MFALERVEVVSKGLALWPVADGVEAGVRADFAQRPGVGVAVSADMQLLGPALFGVETAEEQHHEGCELPVFGRVGGFAGADPVEDGGRHLL